MLVARMPALGSEALVRAKAHALLRLLWLVHASLPSEPVDPRFASRRSPARSR
jgi:hypothetical protein